MKKSAIIGMVSGFANGLFGAGGGTILVPAMEKYLGVDAHKAHATAIAVMLPFSIVSASIYCIGTPMDLSMALWVSIGGAIGGFVGAKCLTCIPKCKLHKLFGAFMVVAAVRMIV